MKSYIYITWWLIPLSKYVMTLVISGLTLVTLVVPLITRDSRRLVVSLGKDEPQVVRSDHQPRGIRDCRGERLEFPSQLSPLCIEVGWWWLVECQVIVEINPLWRDFCERHQVSCSHSHTFPFREDRNTALQPTQKHWLLGVELYPMFDFRHLT